MRQRVKLHHDRTRIAQLWLLDDAQTILNIPEADWPPATHGDDKHAATRWHEITGLHVTILTTSLTTTYPHP